MKNIFLTTIICLFGAENAFAATSYMDMSLEELMNVTLTSMSKREQSIQDTAAAVTVLTSEDIRRSGATSIADALRMVPGLMVGQSSTGEWAVASRGRSYNPTFDNKLLVLIDGRSVYSPLYSGVFWESLDILMEDIDRIEVIRGPGTSIWGANAVNGVINIITKSSADTQGVMASALYGNKENGTGSVRSGGKFGEQNTYRLYAKYRNLDGFEDLDGNELHDGQESGLAGFRMDLVPDSASTLMLTGDIYSGSIQSNLIYPDLSIPSRVLRRNDADVLRANLTGRYDRKLGEGSSYTLETYYSSDSRDSEVWDISTDTADVDLQYRFVPWQHHLAQWGLGYRYVKSKVSTEEGYGLGFGHSSYDDNLFSAFLQDEISLGDWLLTIGSKFQHNDQTGMEYMPSAHLLWHVTPAHSLWGAVSRAIRTPSIVEQDAVYDIEAIPSLVMGGPFPGQISAQGNSDIDSEDALVYELGYRFTPSRNLYFDTSAYITKTDNMLGAALDMTQAYLVLAYPTHVQIDGIANNDVSGTIYGIEISATWSPVDWWKLQGWYSHCEDDYDFSGDGENLFESAYGHITPRHQFFLRSSFDMPYNTELDILGRYVSKLPGLDISDYTTLDVRLGWRPQEHLEISLVGRNLLEHRHEESSTNLIYGSAGALQRSVFLRLQVDF